MQEPSEETTEPGGAPETGTGRENHLGRIFAIPDAWWGFEALGREDHPGACVSERRATREWVLLKGTGAEHREKYDKTEIVVVPSDVNGLLKITVFSVYPRPFRDRRLKNLVPERVMGQLSLADLQRLQGEMIRQFGLQG